MATDRPRTQQTEDHSQDFERYARVTADLWLADDAPVPPSWPGGRESWAQWREAALKWHRLRASFEFARLVAAGYRPHETHAGLDADAVELPDGSLIRRDDSGRPTAEQTARGHAVLKEAHTLRVQLNAVVESELYTGSCDRQRYESLLELAEREVYAAKSQPATEQEPAQPTVPAQRSEFGAWAR